LKGIGSHPSFDSSNKEEVGRSGDSNCIKTSSAGKKDYQNVTKHGTVLPMRKASVSFSLVKGEHVREGGKSTRRMGKKKGGIWVESHQSHYMKTILTLSWKIDEEQFCEIFLHRTA